MIISLSLAAMTHTGSIEFLKKKACTTRMESLCPRETASQLTTNTLARLVWTRATRAALCLSSSMACNMNFALEIRLFEVVADVFIFCAVLAIV